MRAAEGAGAAVNTDLVLSSSWSNPDRRKVLAAAACQDFDETALQEMVRTYILLESRKGGRTSPQTLRAYASGLRVFLAFCRPDPERSPEVPPLKCTRDDLRRFVYQRQLTVAPESVRLNLAAVRTFYRALVWTGVLGASPAEGVSAPPDPRAREDRRDAVPWEDYARLREVAEGETPTHKRNLALLYMLGSVALRVSETAALNVRDVARGEVRVLQGKGGKSRRLELTAKAEAAVKVWLEVRPAVKGEDALFVNTEPRTRAALSGRRMSPDAIRTTLKKLLREAELPEHYSPHSLRHAGLLAFLEATNDIQLTATRAGHSSIETTTIYTKRSRTRMREAVAKIPD